MKIIKFFVLVFLCFNLFSCNDSKEEITQENVILPFLKKQAVNKHLTTITSREELESVINLHYEKLFSKIPSNELLGLIESIRYNERGITTFRYDYLEHNLSDDECLKVCKAFFIVEQRASRAPHQQGV